MGKKEGMAPINDGRNRNVKGAHKLVHRIVEDVKRPKRAKFRKGETVAVYRQEMGRREREVKQSEGE
jgi:hypothetical protein